MQLFQRQVGIVAWYITPKHVYAITTAPWWTGMTIARKTPAECALDALAQLNEQVHNER
jgi:hypothetical protein